MRFPPSVQFAKNVKVILQCGACFRWRVLYSMYSLKRGQKKELEWFMEDLEYTCGSCFADTEADEQSVLNSIYAKANLTCNSPIEIPYYRAGKDPICYHCGGDSELQNAESNYPICLACLREVKKAVPKRAKQPQ